MVVVGYLLGIKVKYPAELPVAVYRPRLLTREIKKLAIFTAVGIFVGKIGARSTQIFFTWSSEENHAWLMLVYVKNRIEMQRR